MWTLRPFGHGENAVLFYNLSSTGVDLAQKLFRWEQNVHRPLPWAVLCFSVGVLLFGRPAQAQELVPSTRIEFLKYESMATTVAQSQDGPYIAIGARDVPGDGSRVVLWNRITDERVRNVAFSANRPPKLAFDSSGTRLAVAPAEGGSSLWYLRDDQSDTSQLTTAPLNDLDLGFRGTLGVGETSGPRGEVRVWSAGVDAPPTVLETDRPVRSIAFSNTTSDVVLATGPTQATLWNYRFNTTKQFDTFEQCKGELRQVEMSDSADHFYLITQRRAECDPDYLCRINAETGSVTDRFRRKNIRNLVAFGNDRVAFSRGRYVYTLNLRTREERIVFQSDNEIHDLSYANGRLVVANSDVVVFEL